MRRRADLTFKQNIHFGRHGWLRLTPAYSVVLVEEILAEHRGAHPAVLEPFCGTGTTPLSAAYRGSRAFAVDINPFLIWLARAKAAVYTADDKAMFERHAADIEQRFSTGGSPRAAAPPLRHIERWWSPEILDFLCAVRAEIGSLKQGPSRDLLSVAFCRTLIALSNAAFNHVSMSFHAKTSAPPRAKDAAVAQLRADVAAIGETCLTNPTGRVTIERGDSRSLAGAPSDFDLLITSPPYPNRISYVRELRPYMYWLGYLEQAREAGDLDWSAIGGTWGIATSRLSAWTPSGAYVPNTLSPVLDRIRASHPQNGPLMAQYVLKYFDDMFHHFAAARQHLTDGGTAHYVVGNASFYGHLVPTEALCADQLERAGFREVRVRPLRKRGSNKQLVESLVSAVK